MSQIEKKLQGNAFYNSLPEDLQLHYMQIEEDITRTTQEAEGRRQNVGSKNFAVPLRLPLAFLIVDQIALREKVKVKEDEWELFKQSIRDKGIMNPITVRRSKEGKFVVIDGRQRYEAATELSAQGFPVEIPVNYLPNVGPDDVAQMQVVANFQRFATKPAQFANHLKRYQHNHPHLTLTEIAKEFNISTPHASNLLKLNKLIEPAQDLVNEGKITIAAGTALAQIPAEDQEAFLDQAQTMNTESFCAKMMEVKSAANKAARGEKPDAWAPQARVRKSTEIKEHFFNVVELLPEDSMVEETKQLVSTAKDQGTITLTAEQVEQIYNLGQLDMARWAVQLDDESIKKQYDEKERLEQERLAKGAEKQKDKDVRSRFAQSLGIKGATVGVE